MGRKILMESSQMSVKPKLHMFNGAIKAESSALGSRRHVNWSYYTSTRFSDILVERVRGSCR